ncbi:MAG TPA: hypothetical protein VGX97_05280 [bacterium]|nr:hypothetical protein [bacterium]
MMLRTTHRRTAGRAYAGARGHLRYATAYRRAGSLLGTARPSATCKGWAVWWQRLADDRELVGAKLLMLAALLVLTALLERVV